MASSRLNVLQPVKPLSKLDESRLKILTEWENTWRSSPEREDPDRKSITRFKKAYLLELLKTITPSMQGQRGLDAGCGNGWLTHKLAQEGLIMDGVDASETALYEAKKAFLSRAHFEKAVFPNTKLPSGHYSMIVARDLIAEIPTVDQRLFISELSRLLKNQGKLFLTSPLNINSIDAKEKLITLLQTEFEIEAIYTLNLGWAIQIEKWLTKMRLQRLLKRFRQSDKLIQLLNNVGSQLSRATTESDILLIAKRRSLFQTRLT
jgi:2-polyprenyl-3-methyl-5-hydroxy-6-metoxy-1,4-benzoquinol methylase